MSALFSGAIDRSLASHVIRKAQRSDLRPLELTEQVFAPLEGEPAPRPPEQRENLILTIGERQKSAHEWASLDLNELAALIGVTIPTETSDEPGLSWLFAQMADDRLFDHQNDGSNLKLRLTFAGWRAYDDLLRIAPETRTAFMAMKFDSAMIKVLEGCFKPAAARAGFVLRPINEEQAAGLIDNQIRAAIRRAAFVVADLSHHNLGAYFEAGFAEGVGAPVIYTCRGDVFHAERKENRPHFDANHMVTVIWEEGALKDAENRLAATIRATLPTKARMDD